MDSAHDMIFFLELYFKETGRTGLHDSHGAKLFWEWIKTNEIYLSDLRDHKINKVLS